VKKNSRVGRLGSLVIHRRVMGPCLAATLAVALVAPFFSGCSTPQPASSCQRKFICSFEDFLVHTRSHAKRVKVLGMAVFDRYSGRFPGVARGKLLVFLVFPASSQIDSVLSDEVDGVSHCQAEGG